MTHPHHHHASSDQHGHAGHGSADIRDHGGHLDDAVLHELLDLDAVALADSWARIHALVADAAPAAVSTVVDLGAGTGTGTAALAGLFPSAAVVAVDSFPQLPARLAAKGVDGSRVRAVVADLDHGWPELGPLDVVWASMSLHHLGDPDRTLREVFAATTPGGLLATVEFDEPVRVLAPGARAGLEDRAMAVLRGVHARDVPEIGAHWPARIAAAGFEVVGEVSVEIDVAGTSPAARRYAQLWLGRMAAGAAADLDPADVAALHALATDDGIAAADVRLHGVRTLTLARRP